jgi:hypothetical protein
MTTLQQKPVDFPSLASKGILKLSLISRSQSARRLRNINRTRNI